jgi:hypothetical protein
MVVSSAAVFWIVLALLFLAGVVLLGLAGVLALGAVARAQSRGYRPTLVTSAVLVFMLLWAAVPVLVVWRTGGFEGPSPPTDLMPIVVVFACVLAMVIAAFLSWRVARALPATLLRHPGLRRRRHRYRLWSVVVGVLTLPAVVWAGVKTSISTTYRVGISGLTLAIGLNWLERRLRSQVETLPPDLHGHVLYLRPFLTERRARFRLPSKEAEFTGQGQRQWVTLDQFLAKEVNARLGPFVALGNPSEVLPPGGATRVYLSDDSWQPELARLAERARSIILEPGRTGPLRWELECIVQKGLQTRLFIVTPPSPGRWLGSWNTRLIRMMDALNGWHDVPWPEFVRELADVGLYLAAETPGPGAVITFTPSCSEVVLAQGVTTPAQMVDAIGAHL